MKKELSVNEYLNGIKNKDLSILAKAITLIESKKKEHQTLATELVKEILPLTGKAKRIGISGTPGVGKSTFLEKFGMYLIENNQSLAVLAIDPTSQITGGSILGDKTRMSELSAQQNAYIRPSPNGSTLGGIAAKSRETMLLCDAFGFDYIFIETVGVGQSEISVSHIVDMFVLLMQPGSGDELQGIKRGILEVSDLVIVNKADGDYEKIAKIAQHDYKKSLEVLQEKRSWKTQVLCCSSLYKKGFAEIESSLQAYFSQYDIKGRDAQVKEWLFELLNERFRNKVAQVPKLDSYIKNIQSGKKDVLSTVDTILAGILKDD
ncbi:MAG: methylmalonyl Co-A mutase-associated GTPase MeaB [Halobacteriovoraceae bacterium]|jgi:LAO/AO transport system kinase|nr:methylmalonyl Co-A mutase-associated GTPase MeaB [Halobacteriovoraceae bacterium]